jgi:hypothetical protein
MNNNKPVNEEKTASASYVITFYQNVTQLTAFYGQYLNFLLIMENKFKGVHPDKIEPAYKEQLVNLCGQLRFYATSAFIQYTTLAKHIRLPPDTEILTLQENIENNLIIERKNIKAYVLKLNEVLASEIMKTLLMSSQSIIDSVFSNADIPKLTQ